MMRMTLSFLVTVAVLASTVCAFAPVQKTSRKASALSAFLPPVPPAVEINVAAQQAPTLQQSSSQLLIDGLQTYVSSAESSTHVLSLKDRPPPPTAEEIAEKQRNFNLWFWGGGFVAPFLATFYYFGFKFWER